jgi:hypothetical protein
VEKRGLLSALQAAGVTQTSSFWQGDEMRFGLWGQVRRRWGRKGGKVVQPVQIVFEWPYLVLAVDVIRCELRWDWVTRMNQEQLVPVFKHWSPTAVVWDGAPAHHGQDMAQVGFARIFLPPYSPELNPPERVFEEIRRAGEGIVGSQTASHCSGLAPIEC